MENEERREQSNDVTQLLVSWSDGDESAFDRLFPMIYDALRKQARSFLRRERDGHTLQTTALVNEAYMKLIGQRDVRWQNRAHFFAIAAQAMRRILLDYARRNVSEKRGGGAQVISLDDAENGGFDVTHPADKNLIALDESLKELERIDEVQSKIVELRYFGGLTVDETAEVMKISPRTVAREWAMAKAWLYRELTGEKI